MYYVNYTYTKPSGSSYRKVLFLGNNHSQPWNMG